MSWALSQVIKIQRSMHFNGQMVLSINVLDMGNEYMSVILFSVLKKNTNSIFNTNN